MIKSFRALYSAFKLFYAISGILLRFFLGRNGVLSGDRKTNATFFRPATMSLDPSGTALRWEKLPGWQRLLWRLSVLYGILLSLLCSLLYLTGRIFSLPRYLSPSFVLLAHLAVAALLFSLWFLRRHVDRHGYRIAVPVREVVAEHADRRAEKRWTTVTIIKEGRFLWEKEKVLPVAGIVSVTLGVALPLLADKRRAVSIPRSYREGAPIVISLPAEFAGVTEKVEGNLRTAVAKKLGVKEISSSMQLEGSSPRILLRVPAALPELITFSEVEGFLRASSEYNPFYGMTAGGEGLNISMEGDSPHLAVSAGSGAGKSEMIKVISMQALHWGWNVIVLDWKEESQEWIKGLDGVRYVTDMESIHDMGVALGEEVEARKANPGAPRPKILIICEEWSLTADLLADYWNAMRSRSTAEEKREMPTRSPALTGFKKIIYTGRALGMFEMLVAIRFSTRVTGGNADLRESFQVILMARYKGQTIKMLAPHIKPFPANKPKERGRWVAVMGDEAVVFRAPLITDDEARAFAVSGVKPSASPFIERYSPLERQRGSVRATLGDQATSEVAGGSRVLEAEPVQITTKKLSELPGLLLDIDPDMTYKTLQMARDKSETSGFPAPYGGSVTRGYTYDVEAVRMWTKKRIASQMIGSGS